jgi:fructose-1,6-bisphosphatase/inositol monophosphatase family enzyme
VDDLALAAALVRDAGLLAARMWAEGVRIERKTSVSDVVTAADHAAEDLIADRLRAERPRDGIVGEEGTSTAPSGGSARTWYVDPVDGTYNFSSGLPTWCAAVALADRQGVGGADGTLLGAIYQPSTDELWCGGRDAPTTRNGTPVPTLTDRPLAELSIASYLHPTTLPDRTRREPLLRAMGGAATVRMLGSGSVELAAVAAGRLGVWLQTESLPWDWLPGAALVRAAGGHTEVFEAHGHRWHVAGPPTAAREAVALVRG